jgi:2,3-diketo-5-methylthio-1-phosphopentane phosphatase
LARRSDSILITDFDGTVTRRDFYALVVPDFLEPGLPDYWAEYSEGRISHFEAMRSIFSHIRASEATIHDLIARMRPDPDLKTCIERLRAAGWEVEIVSAGCRWYIDRVLDRLGVDVTVHASPGRFDPAHGLIMELDPESPYSSRETGIDKAAVVRDALSRYGDVAFAGDGRPDFDAAMMVAPDRRFATGWLAHQLKKRRQRHRRFEWWSDIADQLLAG